MSKKILVIEDEELVRSNLVDLLELEDFDTCWAVDGRDGLEKAAAELPDLVLCDVMMPEMDGYEVLKALRETPGCEVTPFLFLSAKADKDCRRAGMDLGAADYVTKPFTQKELLTAIRARLDKHTGASRHFASKLSRLRDSLTHSISHELLTPLNGILGLSEILTHDAGDMDAPTVSSLAKDIHGEGERLHSLILKYLVYTDLELLASNPARAASCRESRLEDAAGVLTEAARSLARDQSRTDDLQLEVEQATLAVSAHYYRHLSNELLDNALKFSRSSTPLRIVGKRAGSNYVLSVENHGCGMTSGQIAEVGACMQFDRGRREQQGSGLGLAIVQLIVHVHGGAFSITSTPGQQVTVEVSLPIADEECSPVAGSDAVQQTQNRS